MGIRRGRQSGIVKRNPIILNTTQKESASLYIPKSAIWILLILAVIAGLGYLFFISNYFEVRQVLINGEISKEGRNVIESYKGKNIFFIDNYKLERNIRAVYPEAFQIKVYKGIPSTLKVVITKRTVALLWQSNNKNYLVDDMGIVFGEVKNLDDPKLKKLSLIQDVRNFKVKLGQRLISSKFISFVEYINNNFDKKEGVKLMKIEIDETSFHPILVTEPGWRVFLDSNRSPDNQLDDLGLILAKHKAEIREYVDLRVAGYGYWK